MRKKINPAFIFTVLALIVGVLVLNRPKFEDHPVKTKQNPVQVETQALHNINKPIVDVSGWQRPSEINYDTLSQNISGAIVRVHSGGQVSEENDAAYKNGVDKVYKEHITEFQKVKGCPLARALRNRFKRTKTWPSRRFLCVYSEEVLPNLGREIVDSRNEPAGIVQTDFQEGRTDLGEHNWNERKAQINGTVAHITASFGFMLAGIILHHFYKERTKNAF